MIMLMKALTYDAARSVRFWRPIASVLLICLLIAPAFGQAPALKERVQAQTIEFMQAFLRRPLTRSELAQISNEEIAKKTELSEELLEGLAQITRTLQNEDGSPAAWRYRHNIIKNMLFDPAQQKNLSVKLALAVDPVNVLDAQHQQFMTSREVLSVVYIARFAKFGGEPAAIDAARDPRDATAAAMLGDLLSKGVVKGGNLPEMFVNAGGFWSGLVREWSSLSSDEKGLVRRYINDTLSGRMNSLPEAMYMKLMGWTKTEAGLDRLNKTIDRTMQMMLMQSRTSMMKSLMIDGNPAWLVGPQ